MLGQSRDNQTKRGWPYSMSMGLCPTRALEPRYKVVYEKYKDVTWCIRYRLRISIRQALTLCTCITDSLYVSKRVSLQHVYWMKPEVHWSYVEGGHTDPYTTTYFWQYFLFLSTQVQICNLLYMYWDLPSEKAPNKFGSQAGLRTRQLIKWRVSLLPRVRKTIRPIRCCVSCFLTCEP